MSTEITPKDLDLGGYMGRVEFHARKDGSFVSRELYDEVVAENTALKSRVEECEQALIYMVQQYTRIRENHYSHEFMTAGETAFDYLTKYHLAKYTKNGIDIEFDEEVE